MIESLFELIRVTDYYEFEKLIENTSIGIKEKYNWLSDQYAIELLKTIDLLHFSRKTRVEKFVIEYVVCNFSRIDRMQGFLDLFDKNNYYSIIDAMSKASWEKRIRNYEWFISINIIIIAY